MHTEKSLPAPIPETEVERIAREREGQLLPGQTREDDGNIVEAAKPRHADKR